MLWRLNWDWWEGLPSSLLCSCGGFIAFWYIKGLMLLQCVFKMMGACSSCLTDDSAVQCHIYWRHHAGHWHCTGPGVIFTIYYGVAEGAVCLWGMTGRNTKWTPIQIWGDRIMMAGSGGWGYLRCLNMYRVLGCSSSIIQCHSVRIFSVRGL